MNTRAAFCSLVMCLSCVVGSAADAEDANAQKELRIDAPRGWNGERIELPPTFAPTMRLKGIEEIRFAPGMFDAQADSFFSYVLIFQVASEPKLTQELLHQELLAYYRGLAVTVLKGREISVAPQSFTLKLVATKPAKDAPRPQGLASYHGELDWVEPFTTRKRQTLRLDLEAWEDSAAKQSYLFVLASPQPRQSPIWTTMRKIRASFHRQDQ